MFAYHVLKTLTTPGNCNLSSGGDHLRLRTMHIPGNVLSSLWNSQRCEVRLHFSLVFQVGTPKSGGAPLFRSGPDTQNPKSVGLPDGLVTTEGQPPALGGEAHYNSLPPTSGGDSGVVTLRKCRVSSLPS